jgi:hypothetical protein
LFHHVTPLGFALQSLSVAKVLNSSRNPTPLLTFLPPTTGPSWRGGTYR